jgi:1-acyl-sn-glycerol-3-phosphate acyltransferase
MKIVFFVRSVLCDLLMYFLMALIGILGMPYAIWSRKNTYNVIRFYCHSVFLVLKYVACIKVEFRGKIPSEPCIICSKHQSFLDVMMLASVLPDYRFIMKHQLTHLPVIGFYTRQTGTVAVNRTKKAGTVTKMIASLNKETDRQTIVYPQGTRVLPYEHRPYKVGAGLIYKNLNLKCYLVATNTGMFWARRSLYRYPGTAIVEFIDALEEGLEVDKFMLIAERKIEAASTRLMDEVVKR